MGARPFCGGGAGGRRGDVCDVHGAAASRHAALRQPSALGHLCDRRCGSCVLEPLLEQDPQRAQHRRARDVDIV